MVKEVSLFITTFWVVFLSFISGHHAYVRDLRATAVNNTVTVQWRPSEYIEEERDYYDDFFYHVYYTSINSLPLKLQDHYRAYHPHAVLTLPDGKYYFRVSTWVENSEVDVSPEPATVTVGDVEEGADFEAVHITPRSPAPPTDDWFSIFVYEVEAWVTSSKVMVAWKQSWDDMGNNDYGILRVYYTTNSTTPLEQRPYKTLDVGGYRFGGHTDLVLPPGNYVVTLVGWSEEYKILSNPSADLVFSLPVTSNALDFENDPTGETDQGVPTSRFRTA